MASTLEKIISIKSLDELSAPELAEVIRFLISHEAKPGGPYEFKNRVDNALINNHLYNLFAEKGKKLNPDMIFHQEANKLKSTANSKVNIQNTDKFYGSIMKDIEQSLSPSIMTIVETVIQKIKSSDNIGEISKLSETFYNSLKEKYQNKFVSFSKNRRDYSLANIYTWITYSLVDRLLDAKFEASMVPLITILQRKIIRHYKNAGVNTRLLESLFNDVDVANLQELELRNSIGINIEKNTVSVYKLTFGGIEHIMSEKSIAHILGPLNITEVVDRAQLKDVRQALSLYCSSRQLNDDLHDWVEDFSAGQITFVVGLLLNAANISIGTYNYTDLLHKMKEAYWNEVLAMCCRKIQIDIDRATTILEENILKENSDFISLFLKPISTTALEALNKHNYDKSFLDSMNI